MIGQRQQDLLPQNVVCPQANVKFPARHSTSDLRPSQPLYVSREACSYCFMYYSRNLIKRWEIIFEMMKSVEICCCAHMYTRV